MGLLFSSVHIVKRIFTDQLIQHIGYAYANGDRNSFAAALILGEDGCIQLVEMKEFNDDFETVAIMREAVKF
jgi:hypothetical protein